MTLVAVIVMHEIIAKGLGLFPTLASQHFFESKLRLLDNNKYSAYLLTGQSDLSGWKDNWINKTFEKMRQNPKT